MKVVVAPDTFSGSLAAAAAASAIAAGWSSVRPQDELVLVPMADGGDGTVDVVAAAVSGAQRRETEVLDARGRPAIAAWLALPDGRALLESAQACGLARLAADERDPATATSFGVGQLVLAARAAGHRTVVIGLGGSATVDGGVGAARALGHSLASRGGELVHADRGTPLGATVVVAADVSSPLLGPDGAVARFALQKGASAAQLPSLERALSRLADVVERDLAGGPWRELAGAGAAGGLGFGLAAFCGARIAPGAQIVADLVELPAALESAALVVTGEGKLDRQTATGKVPAHVLRLARRREVKAFAIAGRLEDGAGDIFDAVAELGPDGLRLPAELLAVRAAELARSIY
ncbi:MAG: glycerate kinase [Gaiellaceae bacterium MAG52_C11]|nr:glycerate kinase [Candidatus Gaiellasilicea maunaloa]